MLFWKPLLVIVPAGLALGAAGGNWAHPVMTQNGGDNTWQSLFQSRADRYGLATEYPAQPQGTDLPYAGGYSYAPDMGDKSAVAWSPPDYYHFADVPLPTVAQLDAKQAALLADPDVEYRTPPPEMTPAVAQAADQAQAAAQDANQAKTDPASPPVNEVAMGPEPSAADNNLPAIW